MYQWLLENGLEFIVLTVGIVIAFVKMQKLQEVTMREVSELKDVVRLHHEAPMPHLGCPAHDATLIAIKDTLDEVRTQLKELDKRIFDYFIKNK